MGHSKQPTYPPLPDKTNPYIRLIAVLELVKLGHTRFYELISEGKMPHSIRCGRFSYWRVDKLREALEKLQNETANREPLSENGNAKKQYTRGKR